MKKMINTENIEGRIYQHNLTKKIVQNKESKNFGGEYIAGNIDVAIDENGLVVIPVHFTYVTDSKKATYDALEKIINENHTWITEGKDNATKVRISANLAINDFYTQDDRLVSTKVNEGAFVNIINGLHEESERNNFTMDFLATQATRIEADPDNNVTEDYMILKGAVFNFRNELLPVDFIIRDTDGMNYYEDLNISTSEPVLTKVWGKIDCRSLSNVVKEETAFGEEAVRTFERKIKDWVITGGAKVPYDFGEEGTLTIEELTKAMQDRELKLAETKKRRDDYQNQKATPVTAPKVSSTPSIPKGTFNF